MLCLLIHPTIGCNNWDDAIRWAESNRDAAGQVRKEIPTFKQFSDGFFVPGNEFWMKRLKRKKKTYASDYFNAHLGRLDNYILEEFGGRLISSISTEDIDNWFLDLVSVRTKKELSDNAKNKVLHAFRIVLEDESTGVI
jgi:hypothetical protein